MKGIIALLGTLLLAGACVPQYVPQAPSGQGGSGEAAPPREAALQAALGQGGLEQRSPGAPPSGSDSAIFPGRAIEELYTAAKIALADCLYVIKSSDPGGGLLIATRRAGSPGEMNLPTATIMIFTGPTGSPGVKVQVVRPGQSGDPSGENRAEIESILAGIQDLLR